ncbi:MAG TPA: response regulator transcription factor [Actinomycetes bacterium]|nr:response regulator transcription factor [Actinomycetes bacterium]
MLVEDHTLLAQALHLALRAEGLPARVVDPEQRQLGQRLLELAPATVLLDLDLGGFGPADALIGPLTAHGCQVVVLTGETDRARWGECLLAGATAVLAKSEPLEVIIEAVRASREGRPVMDERDRIAALRASAHQRAVDAERFAPFARLTPREQAVLAALVAGHAVAVIAAESAVSQTTVRTQIRAILTKLGVGSQLQAVAMARQVGWPRETAVRTPG